MRKQRPRGLLTCPGRRGLPLVGVTRLTREEVLERFEQRGRLVVGDALGEIEVIDGMAESVEVLGEPAAELAPGRRVGHGRGWRSIRRDNLAAPCTREIGGQLGLRGADVARSYSDFSAWIVALSKPSRKVSAGGSTLRRARRLYANVNRASAVAAMGRMPLWMVM